jgi:hypothetical protein
MTLPLEAFTIAPVIVYAAIGHQERRQARGVGSGWKPPQQRRLHEVGDKLLFRHRHLAGSILERANPNFTRHCAQC